MERHGAIHPDEDAPLSPSEARFEALLEERFSQSDKEHFAREIAAHDRSRAPVGFDPEVVRRRLRFHGEVAPKVADFLKDWLPGLMAQAAAHGLRLRDPHLDIEVFTRAAFEAAQGELPANLPLPASSYRFDAPSRRYAVRVVLPEALTTVEGLLTVLRSLLARIFGDVYLREEVYSLEAYREDMANQEEPGSVGLAQQLMLLAELPVPHAGLEAALGAYARAVGINYKKHPEQARKSYFKDALADFDRLRLNPDTQRLVEEAFDGYLADLRNDASPEIARLTEAVEALNRQLTFLPPDESPEYDRLRQHNPLHYLRSVKLRLEFLLEALAGLLEDFDALEEQGPGLSPEAEDRVSGNLTHLEREGLARPYLVPDVQLSEELQRKRTAFPLEVQGIMTRFPATGNPEKLFHTLQKKLTSSLPQRLYQALLLERHWLRLRESGRDASFPGSAGHQSLKGAAANFRFRRPLLEALFVRIGVVLDVAEQQAALLGEAAKTRFPTEAFARAWGQYAAHAALAGFLSERPLVKGFDAGRYWAQLAGRLNRQAEAGQPAAQLLHTLVCLGRAADDPLAVPVEVLNQSSPAFRFAVMQALKSRPEGKTPAEWVARLEASARAVLEARATSLQYAIVIDEPPGQ